MKITRCHTFMVRNERADGLNFASVANEIH